MNLKELVNELYQINAIKFGEFKLVTGIISPIYFDLRVFVSYPQVLKAVACVIWEQIEPLNYDLICGVPYTALPIATTISVAHNKPMIMRRKETKAYGTKKSLEGAYRPGQNVIVIEDLVTSGASIFETIEPMEQEGLKITDIAVLIDREQGGKKNLADKGYTLHAAITVTEILDILLEAKKLTPQVVNDVKKFIEANQVLPIRKS